MHSLVQSAHGIFQDCVGGGAFCEISAHVPAKHDAGAVFCAPVQIGGPFDETLGPPNIGVASTKKGH